MNHYALPTSNIREATSKLSPHQKQTLNSTSHLSTAAADTKN